MSRLHSKITILGGSSIYTPLLIKSLVSYHPNNFINQIVLYGRSYKKLANVGEFSKRLIRQMGTGIDVKWETNLEYAIENSEFIINQIRVGNKQSCLKDWKIPLRYGLVPDGMGVLGASGFYNALRTIPVVYNIGKTIKKVSPSAWVINLTNPCDYVVQLFHDYFNIKAVGVCDQPLRLIKKIAVLLRIPFENLSAEYFGLNHFGWIKKIYFKKKDITQELFSRIKSNDWKRFDFELIKIFGLIPTQFTHYFFYSNDIFKMLKAHNKKNIKETLNLIQQENKVRLQYKNKRKDTLPKLLLRRDAIWYSEIIVPLIFSIRKNLNKRFILMIPNQGSIRSIDPNAIVEIQVHVTNRTVQTAKSFDIPQILKGLFQQLINCRNLTIDAILERSYKKALQALTINPLIPSLNQAKQYLNEILKDNWGDTK